MKNRLRNLVVDGVPFAYRCAGGPRFTLHLWPKHDKNTRLTLIFAADPPEEEPRRVWTFYEIEACKQGETIRLRPGQPRLIADIARHLRDRRPALWQAGQRTRIENAWTLLGEMGYSACKPLWTKEF